MPPSMNVNESALRDLIGLPVGGWNAADLLMAREALGLKQAELAAAIGYDRSAIAKIEGGDSSPRLVVELAVRYLVDHRPQGGQFRCRMDMAASRFRSVATPIGISEATFPGGQDVEVYLADGPAIWLRLMPEFDAGTRFTAIELKRAATQMGFPLIQLMDGYSQLGFVRAADGFGVFGMATDRSTVPAVSFAFQTGEIWSVDTYIVDALKRHADPKTRPGLLCFEDRFKLATHRFRLLLIRLGLKAPFRWVAGVEGIKGTGLFYPPRTGQYFPFPGPQGTALVDAVSETGMIDDGESPASALKPFFEKLFGAFNAERPAYLDELSNPQ